MERLLLKRWTRVRFPVRSNLRLLKLGFAASLLDVQQLKGQCEASTVCGRQVAALSPEQGNLVNKMYLQFHVGTSSWTLGCCVQAKNMGKLSITKALALVANTKFNAELRGQVGTCYMICPSNCYAAITLQIVRHDKWSEFQ